MKLKVVFVMGCVFSASLFAQGKATVKNFPRPTVTYCFKELPTPSTEEINQRWQLLHPEAYKTEVLETGDLEKAREHSLNIDEAYTSLLSSLRQGDLTGALSASKTYFDLYGMPEFTPVFEDFIYSTLTKVNNCSEAYLALDFVLFKKGSEFMNSKMTTLVNGRELELSFHGLRSDLINAVAFNYLNLMNSTCNEYDYEANLVELNKTRVAKVFDDATTISNLLMIDDFFKGNNIERSVDL